LDAPLPTSPEALLAQVEWVRHLARTLVAGEERADDVAQEAWLAALQRPPAHGRNVRAWLAIVTRNIARKFVRGETRRRRNEEAAGAHALASAPSAPPSELPPAAAMVERAELQRRVVAAVLALEEPTRSTLLWRYFEDLTPNAIAAATGVPLATVKTRLKRGLAQLRGRLREDFGLEGREWMAALAPLLPSQAGGTAATTAAASAGAAAGVASVGGVLVMANLKFLAAAVALAGAGGAMAWWVGSSSPAPTIGSARAVAPIAEPENADAPRIEPAGASRVGETVHAAGSTASDGTPVAATDGAAPASALVGRVRDSRGDSVEGADVLVGREQDGGFTSLASVFSSFEWFRSTSVEGSTGVHHAVTDSAGRFTIERLDARFAWSVAAIHPELGAAWQAGVVAASASRPATVDLVLEPGVVFRGRVTRPDGAACANARVEIDAFPRGRAIRSGWGTSFGAISTDENGRYRTLAIPGVAFELTASPPGPPRQRRFIPKRSGVLEAGADGGEREVDLVFDPLVTVRGSLRVADGRPFGVAIRAAFDAGELASSSDSGFVLYAMTIDPRVALGLRPPGDPQWVPSCSRIDGAVDVDAATYSIALLDPGMTHLALIARRKLLAWAPLSAVDGGAPSVNGPELVVDLSSLPSPIHGGTLAVRVVDAATKEPVVRAGLSWTSGYRDGDRTSWRNDAANADVAGTATLELPAGETSLQIQASGYAAASEFVRMVAGAREVRVVELERAARTVVGVVHLPTGGAAAGAKILAYRSTSGGWLPIGPVVPCDSNGRFELREMPGKEFVVVASCPPLAPGVARVDPGVEGIDVTLQAGVAFNVDVVARDERQVGLFRCRMLDAEGIPVVDELRPGSSRPHSGREELHVLPGEYVVEVHAVEYEPNISTQRIVSATAIEFGMHPLRR
jgi:RNA polymerase sigma-70 factor (ECF subfamily)